MARHRYALVAVAVAVAALAVLAMLFGAGAAANDAQRLELDSTHPLASEDATEAYAEEGHVTRNLTRLNAELSYADSLDEVEARCGEKPKVSGWKEPGTEWIVLSYCEDVDRTLRFNLPRDYFVPINGQHRTPGGNHSVTMQPVDGRNTTAVEVTVREPTTVVMPVSKVDTMVFGKMADFSTRMGELTNVSFSLPLVSGGQQWSHVDGERLGAHGSVPIEGKPDEVLVQYETTEDGDSVWLNVPDEPRDSAPVYVQERANETTRVWVVTRTNNPPDIRYKSGGDTSGWLGGVGDDLAQLPDRVAADLPF